MKWLIEKVENGFVLSEPSAHRWNDHGNKVYVFKGLSDVFSHIEIQHKADSENTVVI